MEAINDMAVYFDVDANNQTLKNQFKIGVVTDKKNICTWTFNFVAKTATDKLCVAAHAFNASCIVSVPGRQQFITGGADSAIRLWQNGKAVFSWLQTKPIVTLLLAKNDILWNGDSVGTIRSYNLTSRNPFKTTNLTEHKGKIHSLSASNDSKYLVSCGDDGYVMLWST
jgi:WD40 repeat protein